MSPNDGTSGGPVFPCVKRKRDSDCCSHAIDSAVTPSSSQSDENLQKSRCSRKSLSRLEIAELLKQEADYDISSSEVVQKRSDYISWDEYFMAASILSSHRSKDPASPSGCCIVDPQNRIIGLGYNGFPSGCSDDILPWSNAADAAILHTSAPYLVHAEINAILNKGSADVVGGRLYTRLFPNHECAKFIAQAGISEVIYQHDEYPNSDSSKASRILFGVAGVKTREYHQEDKNIVLNFTTTSLLSKDEADKKQGGSSGQTSIENKSTLVDHRKILLEEAQYDPSAQKSLKRTNCLTWDDYFMAMAFLTAQRSKDPNTQVGACLVDTNKRVVGLGYNGFPAGDSDDTLPWSRTATNALHKKYHYVCHAEVNAVLNKCSNTVKGSTLYVALFPCNECAKVLVQAGIREVVYMADIYHDTDSCRASRILFRMAGVKMRQYTPTVPSITLPLHNNDST